MSNEHRSNMNSNTLERDLLAEHRTTLANERTLLAYTRTALTFFVIGATFVKFFGYPLFEIIGWIFIPVGAISFLKGVVSYRKMKRQIEKVRTGHESS